MTNSDDAETTYPLRAAARLTGLSPDLLRAWESRYGVVKPLRTAGGTRRYRASELERLRLVKAAVDAGDRISVVARLDPVELARRAAALYVSLMILSRAASMSSCSSLGSLLLLSPTSAGKGFAPSSHRQGFGQQVEQYLHRRCALVLLSKTQLVGPRLPHTKKLLLVCLGIAGPWWLLNGFSE